MVKQAFVLVIAMALLGSTSATSFRASTDVGADHHVGQFSEWSPCDPVTKTRERSRKEDHDPKSNGKASPPVVEKEACTPPSDLGPKQASATPNGGLTLVVIDQQVDFHPGGSLAIPTANDDADRIAAFITQHSDEIEQLVFTLDSHQRYHIAHSIFWTNAAGESPPPFTSIKNADIVKGVWSPRDPSLHDYVLAYTSALEANNKFVLTIWPEHCRIGSPGHNIVPNVHAAAMAWAKSKKRAIQFVLKGSNSFTEHYSALRAEYELAYDPATKLNTALIENLSKASKVAIVGEALSHCVNYSVRDLVANWPIARRKDLYVFTDCSSAVPGFEAAAQTFVSDMTAAGLNIMASTDFKK